jgi:hypothetical protein
MPVWGRASALRSTSNHEKSFDPPAISSWGSPSGLRPGFRPARNFTSDGSVGDLVAGLTRTAFSTERPPSLFREELYCTVIYTLLGVDVPPTLADSN